MSVLALIGACATDPSNTTSGDVPGTNTTDVSPPERPQPACPIGAATFTSVMGSATIDQALDLAVDSRGNVAFATATSGVVVLSPSGEVQLTFPVGSVVAAGADGHLIIAGGFTEAIDLGDRVLTPEGNIDTFLVELDAHGDLVFATALGLCGDGVQSLAVSGDGRIALAGTALGTVVLSASGELELQLAFSGDVAFDSNGNLAIGGSFRSIDLGDGVVTSASLGNDVFVAEFDRAGRRLWSHVMASSGRGSAGKAIAIDADDRVVLVGYTEDSIDLLGTTVRAGFDGEIGRVGGGFMVTLDAGGNLAVARGIGMTEANAVAVGAGGHLIVNGATTGSLGFGRILDVQVLDSRGLSFGSLGRALPSQYGRGLAVAVDACGSIYTADIGLAGPARLAPPRSYVSKLAPL